MQVSMLTGRSLRMSRPAVVAVLVAATAFSGRARILDPLAARNGGSPRKAEPDQVPVVTTSWGAVPAAPSFVA
jgi:hypothetical protein